MLELALLVFLVNFSVIFAVGGLCMAFMGGFCMSESEQVEGAEESVFFQVHVRCRDDHEKGRAGHIWPLLYCTENRDWWVGSLVCPAELIRPEQMAEVMAVLCQKPWVESLQVEMIRFGPSKEDS